MSQNQNEAKAVDVRTELALLVADAIPHMRNTDGCDFARAQLKARAELIDAAVAELIEQRDALATAMRELAQDIPRSVRANLRRSARVSLDKGERIAWWITNYSTIDPEALDRADSRAKAGAP